MAGVNKSTDAQYEAKVALIQEQLMRMVNRRGILRFIADNDKAYKAKVERGEDVAGLVLFDRSERMIEYYISDATERMMALRAQELPKLREKLYAAKYQLLAEAVKSGDKNLALKIIANIEDREMGKPLQTVDSNMTITDAEAISQAVKELDPASVKAVSDSLNADV